eukprot:Gb_18589 [translate_table: standard]
MVLVSQYCFLIFLSILFSHHQLVCCGKLGPASNVSKHLTFPDFRAHQRINHDIRLLGNAGLAEDRGIIQIPAVNSRHPNLSFQAGKALYSSPIRMLDPETGTPASFRTTFSFQIDSSPVDSNTGSDGSSGLTFVVVPDELTVGRPGGWLGMLNDACDETYKAFAVEFDTFKNDEFADPNDNHVGINLGSIVSNRTVDAAAAGVSFKNGTNVRAWIAYDGVKRWIELSLARDGVPMPKKPLYSAGLDLSTYLNEYMFVGFSASTGHAAQIHNILSWNFSAVSNAFLRLPTETTCERKMFKLPKIAQREPPSAFLIFLAAVAVFMVVLIYLLCNKKAKDQSKSIATKLMLTGKTARPTPPNKPRRFSMSELSLATRGFNEGEVLGYGDKGIFYKGVLQNSTLIAIKRFSKEFLQGGNIDKNKVMKEVKVLSRLRHPNLVPLKGWCHDKGELVMIYEYMQNGSLDKWLFARGVLPWTRRFKVVKDVAEALGFLHSGWEKNLVHKNIKISNVLLDVTFRARLGDFGLISSYPDFHQDQKKGSDGLKAAHHVPPESVYVQQANDKMDIFNFGVMVLEIVSGRRSMDHNLSPEEVDLVEFAWNLHEKEKLLQVADQRLMMRYNPEQVNCLVVLGLLCTQSDPRARPAMAEVISYINGDMPVPPLPSRRPAAFFLYPSTPQLCMKTCSPASLHILGYKSNKSLSS